jgi:hypothetical protein
MKKRDLEKLLKLKESIIKKGPESLSQAWALDVLKRKYPIRGLIDETKTEE